METIKNQTFITDDGSATLFNAQVGEHYHSTFGAIGESKHIFIEAGLKPYLGQSKISIFEVGFGTGLNALLSCKAGAENQIAIHYTAIELFPVSLEVATSLNYCALLKADQSVFLKMHSAPEFDDFVSPQFYLKKMQRSFVGLQLQPDIFDVIYFDAFSPEAQPEMWTVEGFSVLFNALKKGGVLVTYSCKGTVKRALKQAGFLIEKLPGPPGKREFLRAWKD